MIVVLGLAAAAEGLRLAVLGLALVRSSAVALSKCSQIVVAPHLGLSVFVAVAYRPLLNAPFFFVGIFNC